MKNKLALVAIVAPIVLSVAACSSHKPSIVKGTFPYCQYQPVTGGVFVPEYNHAPCVVDDTDEAGHRGGYHGTHVVIVPRGTGGTRTPLPKYVPATKLPTYKPATKAPSNSLPKYVPAPVKKPVFKKR